MTERGRHARRRALSDLVRRVRALPAGPDRRLPDRPRALHVRLRALRRRLGRRAVGSGARPVRGSHARADPDELAPVTVASVSDNVPDGWRTVAHPLERRPGADVLIVGGGAPSIGLYAVDAARARRRPRHLSRHRRAAPARGRAARRVHEVRRSGWGPTRSPVDAGATRESLVCALRSTEPGGDCTSVGIIYEAETRCRCSRCTRTA